MIREISHVLRNIALYFKEQTFFRKVLIIGGLLASWSTAFFLLLFTLVWCGLLGHLPKDEELAMAENPSASEVYSADSILLGRFFIQERSNITYDQIPPAVIDAVIATEDARFYEHQGIDVKSFGRVLVKSIFLQMDGSGGGSTITQQLAKNLYPRRQYLFFSLIINKIREAIIATRLEEVYDKKTILTLYLNTVPFGENTFGLGAASQLYFSSDVKNLSLHQAATLVGMLKANHAYNPRINPDKSRQRRNVVLSQMVKYNMLSESSADSARALPLDLRYNKITHHAGLAPYFREYIRSELVTWCKRYGEEHDTTISLYTAGLKIYTTLDSRMQRYAEEAMGSQMAVIQKQFERQGSDVLSEMPEVTEQAVRKSDHYKSLKSKGMSHEEIMRVMETPVRMSVFTWEGDKEMTMSPVDSVKYYLKFLNAGVLAMDPESGAIRVWVGGINHQYFQFDHVKTTTKRQVGSTFKPIVYASAIESGERPCAFISAEKITYTNLEDWAPENTQENYNLKYSMPGALAYSVNTVSVRLLEKAGINRTIKLAHQMGITSELEPVPSLALGAANISMTEMVTAYSSFARDGKTPKPFYITSITDHSGNGLEKFAAAIPQQAMSPQTAQMILHMLRRSVNEGGTSAGLRSRFNLSNDIAGKTGTTQSNADGWFIGITPNLVVGAWVGADDPRMKSQATGQGARTALPIVGSFFQRANRDASLSKMTRSRFPELSPSLAGRIDCNFFREDNNLFKKIFVRKERERKKEFGEPKKGFLKKLFGKKKKEGGSK